MKTLLFTTILLIANCQLFGQKWTATKALETASGTTSGLYLIAATSVGTNIYAVGANQKFVHSTNRGFFWTAPTVIKPTGDFVALTGASDRVYAVTKVSTFDYELHYSVNNGTTWKIDTAGLPNNVVNTGKAAMNLRYMGNNYMFAFNATKSCFKKIGATKWTATVIDYTISDVISMNDIWFAIGSGKILKSTDYGTSWTTIATTGLPTNFQGLNFASNGKDRLFVSNAPASGGQDIYISTNGGTNWTLTNSSGHYTHNNPVLGKMYAVDNYVFASVTPANFTDEPPYIVSTEETPNFSVGDVTGLPKGATNTLLPFYFHIGGKLYTMFGDIYVSSPGFTGDPVVVGINEEVKLESFSVYPNPVLNVLNIETKERLKNVSIFDITGKRILTEENYQIDVSGLNPGIYFISIKTENNTQTTRFIKQ